LSDADIIALGFNHTSDVMTWVNDNDANTEYTGGTYLYLSGSVFNVNSTMINDNIESYGYSTSTGTVTSVTGTSPIISSGGVTPVISATILKDLVTTAPLTGAADNIFLGTDSDLTIAMPVASTSADGYLSSTNWNTFNNKAASDTTYDVGNGITLTDTTFTVVGGTALTADAGGLSVTAGGIGDTQIADAYINQALTTTSNVAFNNITVNQNLIINLTGGYNITEPNGNIIMSGNATCRTFYSPDGSGKISACNT